MITYYYKTLRTPAIETPDTYKKGVWIHVENPSDVETLQLIRDFSIEPGMLEDARDEDEIPRMEKEDGLSYIFMRFAYRGLDREPLTAPLLIIFGKDLLITVTQVHLPAVDTIVNGKFEFATTQRAKLVLQLMQIIGEQYDSFVTQSSRRVKQIRGRLKGHEIRSQDFIDFVAIQDELNEFLGALQPMNSVLRRILLGKHLPLFEEDQDIVEDIMLNNEQSIEACTSNIKSIDGIREAHSAISSDSLNRTMKILTVATLGITIPNVCFGIYSMNVPLPLQHRPYMFWIVITFTILLTATVFIIGRRKRLF
jgi:magnesium transporter